MKKRKIIPVLLMLTAMVVLLCGCKRKFTIEAPVKVTLQSANVMVEITDPETVTRLTEEITSQGFRKKGRVDSTGWDYWLKWYDENGEVIFDAIVAPDGIQYNNYVYVCVDGSIDTSDFDTLLENGTEVSQ